MTRESAKRLALSKLKPLEFPYVDMAGGMTDATALVAAEAMTEFEGMVWDAVLDKLGIPAIRVHDSITFTCTTTAQVFEYSRRMSQIMNRPLLVDSSIDSDHVRLKVVMA